MKHKIRLFILFFVLFLSPHIFAGPITITETPGIGSFPLVASGNAASLIVDPQDAEVVTIAAKALSGDIKLITGIQPRVVNQLGNDLPVIIGTIGKSKFIDSLAITGKISTGNVAGKWETFSLSVVSNPFPGVDNALVIYGSDPRGTAFGVFELSKLMGVSPMVWWADVLPKERSSIYITAGESIIGPPSVQYRGIFLNDEDWGLQPWAAKNMDTDVKDIGPKTYERIFELLLRCKANYIWPAMHSCTKAFWYYPGNPVMARKYQIVLGSSHCEQMLRDNTDEWLNNFQSEYGFASGDWNWATNSTNIKRYWTDRVIQSKNQDVVYTIGMRGIADSGLPGYSTDAAKQAALKDIIANQRNILTTNLGKDASKVPQIFCPYKEALTLYQMGLNLADDVTLCWADDNFGYIRQLSNPQEQLRSGGGGVYYHFSYWGTPDSYLWLSSNSPTQASSELTKAYATNSKKLWVFNVGDIKPQELEMEFAMDLAWDVNAWTPDKAYLYSKHWAAETFGAEFAESIGNIKQEYYRLAASGKPEHVFAITYSDSEIKQRLADYENLVQASRTVQAQIPARLQDAYFQLIAYPVEGAANMNVKTLCARQSLAYAAAGKPEALDLSSKAITAYPNIINLTTKYNTGIAGGKWNGMMNYAPQSFAQFYNPTVATASSIKTDDPIPASKADSVIVIPASKYTSKNDAGHTIANITGLGIQASALTVSPLDMTTYAASNVTSAPYAEYDVPVTEGVNSIKVRCLPTFPLYTALNLRYAISVDGTTPVFFNIANAAETAGWSTNILQGFANGESKYQSTAAKTIKVRVYFTDPGLAISDLTVSSTFESEFTKRLVNSNFEFKSEGVLNDGTTFRGIPYGWKSTGTLIGQSFGINKDAMNYFGSNLCWINSTPMPAKFDLYQTLKGLPAGEYVVRCRLAAFTGQLTNVRLFANNNVQYFGNPSDYGKNLTTGEVNTFAGLTGSPNTGALLQEMAVRVSIFNGDSLKLGIHSGNLKSDGTSATDNSGWFKVDYFRVELLQPYSNVTAEKSILDSLITVAQALYDNTKDGTTLGYYTDANRAIFLTAIQAAGIVNLNNSSTQSDVITAISNIKAAVTTYRNSITTYTTFMVNPDFEYKSAGVLNDGTAYRGIPYGWSSTGTLIGNSFGINNDGSNYNGSNLCWVYSIPMPAKFELFQVVKNLPEGQYTLRCRLSSFVGQLTNVRMFANNNVQYYGSQADYDQNLSTGEINAFADYTGNPNTSALLKEMAVDVTIVKGESLKLGIRSSNMKSDGTYATDESGWFKVDNFRLERNAEQTGTAVATVENSSSVKVFNTKNGICATIENSFKNGNMALYSIDGHQISNVCIKSDRTYLQVPSPGVYIAKITLDGSVTTAKVVIY